MNPEITTHIVVFRLFEGRLQLLLRPGVDDMWALPGVGLAEGEDLDCSAKRTLERETGLTNLYLEQLCTFGTPQRVPGRWEISVAYYALVPCNFVERKILNETYRWYSMPSDLPHLNYDHADIVATAYERLVAKLAYSTIALQFMADQFTLSELQEVYETILSEKLDKRNFRKRILALDQVHETGELKRNGNHRPARLYRASNPAQVQITR